MNEYAGLVLLDAAYVLVGTCVLVGIGVARSARLVGLHLGLALLLGWALMGTITSMLLIAGLSGAVWQLVTCAAALCAVFLGLGRRIPGRAASFSPNPGGAAIWLAAGGAGVVLAVLQALLRRAFYAGPVAWDAWAFWLPKAESIVYFHGLDTGVGGFTSFANPDYPPFAPAVESLTYRFAGSVDNGILPLQHWVLATAFLGALAVLLARRVAGWILWPSLALLALMPSYTRLVGSSLADEPLSACIAVASVCAALWLLDGDTRLVAVAGVFLVAATLLKNEGLLFALLVASLLAVTARGRRVRVPLALAAASVAAVVPWKLWLRAHDVPQNPAYDPHDLLRPGFLADRVSRLSAALQEVPQYFFSWSAWLVALPLAIVLGVALARKRPELSVFVLGAVAVALAGNLIVYWVSTFPIHWYIRTTADRTSSTLAIFCAALTPLLIAEAARAGRRHHE